MVDLDKVKAFVADKRGWSVQAPGMGLNIALAHIEALVAEVEALRRAAKGVVEDYDRANEQRWDENKWGEFGGVEALRGSPMIVVPGNKPAVEVREDDGE
jgi:hypothetical protein